MSDEHIKPELKIRHFEGPLDLLFHLIEKNDIDIYDIPIAEITGQYIDFIEQMKSLDMEVTSEFIVMAATLIHIKSRIMLPGKKDEESYEGDDPREELVVSLLRYKRCRMFADELKQRREIFSGSYKRIPATAADFGIELKIQNQEFESELFDKAVEDVAARNEVRFADISSKITHILRRDKLSVRERMKSLWNKITRRGKLFFHELFDGEKTEKIDRIVSFLAVLELLRSNKINVEQERPFDDILIEEKRI